MKDLFGELRADWTPGRIPAAGQDPDRMPIPIRRLLVVSVVLSLVFVAIFVWSDKGLGELRRLDRRADGLREDIRLLTADNARLRAEIESFPKSRVVVERLAREELGLVRPGEVVVLLPARSDRAPADRVGAPRLAEARERDAAATRK